MSCYVYDSCIRGYPRLRIWDPVVGELLCRAEFVNIHDPYATAVLKMGLGLADAVTIGHVPRNISAVCHCFMRNGGTITYQVTGVRRYSTDLLLGLLNMTG